MGSIPIASTIQSLQTAVFPAGLKEADSGGFPRVLFKPFGLR
jgi:hypothetical protein